VFKIMKTVFRDVWYSGVYILNPRNYSAKTDTLFRISLYVLLYTEQRLEAVVKIRKFIASSCCMMDESYNKPERGEKPGEVTYPCLCYPTIAGVGGF
jgi:hypothetical protein